MLREFSDHFFFLCGSAKIPDIVGQGKSPLTLRTHHLNLLNALNMGTRQTYGSTASRRPESQASRRALALEVSVQLTGEGLKTGKQVAAGSPCNSKSLLS